MSRYPFIVAALLTSLSASATVSAKFETSVSKKFWSEVMEEREQARARFALWREQQQELRQQREKRLLAARSEQQQRSVAWWGGLNEAKEERDKAFREKKRRWEERSSAERGRFHKRFEMRVRGYDEHGMRYPYPYPWDLELDR